MSETADILWPGCLGCFDEESCRYFLYEIGMKIVPNYPFSFGIEEVYGQILGKYGFSGTPDVTSLLQELLEDGQNAAGLGDDGDVWRSWRHSWKHRNDDARNPFIPHFGPLILQSSTPARIRCLKANNFTRQFEYRYIDILSDGDLRIDNRDEFEDYVPHKEESNTAIEPSSNETYHTTAQISKTTPSRTGQLKAPWRQRLRSFGRSERVKPARHSRSLSATDAAPAVSLPYEIQEADRRKSTQLRGGEEGCDLITECRAGLRELREDPVGVHCPNADTAISPIQRTPDHLHSDAILATKDGGIDFEQSASAHVQTEKISINSSAGTSVSQIVARLASWPALDDQQSSRTPDHNRRAANRQARLIDGTIFTSRSRRSKTVGNSQFSAPTISEVPDKRSSGRLSWSPIKHRDSLHSNWREIKRLFSREGSDKQTLGSSKHQSVPPPSKPANSSRLENMPMLKEQHSEHLSRLHKSGSQFGLDGAADPPSTFTSHIDLNKPLPLSPGEIVKSLSNRSPLTSSQYSENTSALPSRASTASSVSRSSSKKEFHGLARELLQVDTMLASHELPPIREDMNKQTMVDPKKTPAPLASPVSYTSVARGNPFVEQDLSKAAAKTSALDFSKPHLTKDTSSRSMLSKPQQTESYFPPISRSKSTIATSPNDTTQYLRGRSRPSPQSPTQTTKENLPPKTPTKRSRSPFKRFLGLSKGDSTNKFEDPETPPQINTPGSTKKESLKKWGDRIRYGFLTPDQEQLRQEELIDAHNNSSTNSTPQNSTFPISLEPPVQAKLQSEIELIITVTANRYLLHEARAGRISAESVAKTKELWEKMNRPQVIEFHFDQTTQHNLIMANLDRVKLHGDGSKDAIAINSTMRGWKTMAREMSVRTFCSPDSVIRKHLHDAHRVLELLGAPLVTFLAYEDMQLKTLAKINQYQKERLDRRAGSAGRNFSSASAGNAASVAAAHRRNVSEGSARQLSHHHHHQQQSTLDHSPFSDYPMMPFRLDQIRLSPSPTSTQLSGTKVRKPTGADGAIMSLPTNFEKARYGYTSTPKYTATGPSIKEI